MGKGRMMMPDREKAIKGLTELKKYLPSTMWESINDALSLLKKQEAIAPIPPTDESDLWKCGNCNHQLFRATHQKYCEMCGRKVKWDGRT